MKDTIIWDWNGTLLNDAEYCVDCMNKVLKIHGIESITLSIYKDKFTFPVKDYYSAIGFDFTKIDFKIPAMEFIDEYYSNIQQVDLHNDVISILTHFKKGGYKQYSLSAMEHGQLVSSLKASSIYHYFDGVRGIDDHYAHSKIEMGKILFNEHLINTENAVMIGDTIHDFEVAEKLGIDCILVTGGHQSESRLTSVTDNIAELSLLPDLIKSL